MNPLHIALKGNNKLLINTLNTHSFNVALRDKDFLYALLNSDMLLPDGIGIVFALRFLQGKKVKKIAGYDLFIYELEHLNDKAGSCFFLGSSENVLRLILQRISIEYPQIKVASYSPPFKSEFSKEDNIQMIEAVNNFKPDVLFIGMTAPKQEKWAFTHFDLLNVKHIDCIGAVFDFYAGTIKRAPAWVIQIRAEWLYRLLVEPKRMWRRYLVGNTKFLWFLIKEKIKNNDRFIFK